MHTHLSKSVVQCDPLVNPDNGQVSVSSNDFGSDASYSCDTGYNLVGTSAVTCQADQQWSGSPPTCESMLIGFIIRNGQYHINTGEVLLNWQ